MQRNELAAKVRPYAHCTDPKIDYQPFARARHQRNAAKTWPKTYERRTVKKVEVTLSRPKILFDTRWISSHGIGRVGTELYQRLVRDGYEISSFPSKAIPSSPLDAVATKKAFDRAAADLFVTPGYNGNPLIGRRQIFYIHDMIHFDRRQPGWRVRSFYYDTIIRKAARDAYGVVTVSAATAQKLRYRWPETANNVIVAHNGVSDDFEPPPIKAERRGLIIFANQRWHKNLKGMLHAVSNLGRLVEPLHLIGDLSEETKEQISWMPDISEIVYHSAINDDELIRLMQGVRCLMYCSFEEGFGLPVIEAAACGAEVIVSDIPAIREIAADYAWYVDPHRHDQMTEALKAILNGEVRNTKPRSLKKTFNWEASYQPVKLLVDGF